MVLSISNSRTNEWFPIKKVFSQKKDCWRSLEYSVGGITGDFANHERSQKQQNKAKCV